MGKQPRRQPHPPFPEQQLERPGLESKLRPRPHFEAPEYRGSGKLTDKVALVTGGDSGIGRSVAVLFAREGADVVLVYTDAEQSDAESTRDAVREEGREALLIAGDVRDPDFCERAVKDTVEHFGGLHVLVNNAGFCRDKMIFNMSEDEFDSVMRVHVKGHFCTMRFSSEYWRNKSKET
ncbi:MAG: SDR family NAD(P)-dependent oxidoreductase, partial [Xanthomonadales bacterium]|nr:SDR family NAD(P)-dependent oxidoreductase [Xanthomonadales bacterium]